MLVLIFIYMPVTDVAAARGAEASSGTPYSTPSDLWALGVLLYEMLHLRRPFDGMSLQALFQVGAALGGPDGTSHIRHLHCSSQLLLRPGRGMRTA